MTIVSDEDLDFGLRLGGLSGGLRVLNQRVAHRFTAVYRVDGEVLRIVAIVDKSGKGIIPKLHEVPVAGSFCQYSIRDGEFVSENTGADRRLDGNSYQDFFGSYVGLRLLYPDGRFCATFCHYDLVPNRIEPQELQYLREAVTWLSPYVDTALAR